VKNLFSGNQLRKQRTFGRLREYVLLAALTPDGLELVAFA